MVSTNFSKRANLTI